MYGDDSISMGMSGGPMMEGTWYNPHTGDSFTARDTYFEGDQLVVVAEDGRRFSGDMIADYVQSADGPMSIGKRPEIDPNQDKINPQALLAGMDEESKKEAIGLVQGGQAGALSLDTDPLNQVIGSETIATTTTAQPTPSAKPAAEPDDEDTLLIRRALGRVELPKINCSIKWSKFPSKQLDMLDTLGVPMDKISEYLIEKLDMDYIKEQVKDSLIKSLEQNSEK